MSNRLINMCKNFVTDPFTRWLYMSKAGCFKHMDDRKYIEKLCKIKLGYTPDLDNPKTYCEKLNWLKLYNRKPEYTMMVDKYLVKEYVAERVGAEHVVPLLGAWDRFEDIDFNVLPDQFVLKCNHDGGPVIIKDKSKIDQKALKKLFNKKMKEDYFQMSREWPYKNVKHKIIAEEYLPTLGARDSVEYKITCCNGKVKMITVCTGIAHAEFEKRNNDHFDINWEQYPFYAYYKPSGKKIERPVYLDELVEFAEKLADGIPCIRVDCYVQNNKIYFGELTFFTWGGFIEFTPPEWDQIMGEWIELPPKFNEK